MIIPILLLTFVLRLVNLNQSFWLDEAAQVIESARPFSQQFNIASDFHPPLYHLVLHFWLKMGTSEWFVRLPSVLLGVLSVFFLYQIGRILFDHKTAVAGAMLTGFSAYHIWYSQESRPYILFTFLSLISTYFLLKKRWIPYFVSSLLCMYALYFAPFLFLGHFVYIVLFGKKSFKQYIFSMVLVVAGFLPWIPNFLTQLRIGTGGFFAGWTDIVSQPVIKALPLTFAKFIFGKGTIDNNIVYAAVILPMLAVFFYSSIRLFKNRQGKTLLIFFWLPFISCAILSLFIPVLAPQRLLFLLPFFLLIVSAGLVNMYSSYKILAVFVVCIVNIASVISYYTNPYVQREQWRQAVNYVENTALQNSISLFAFPEPFAPYLWYSTKKVPGYGVAWTFRVSQKDLSGLEALYSARRVYLFQYLTGLTDPDDLIRTYLTAFQFSNIQTLNFPGVGFIYVYDKI